MQLYVAELGLIYVPIPFNADKLLSAAILKRWPSAQAVSDLFPGKRAVMWREPQDRLEAVYWMRKRSGIEEDFDAWVFDQCTTGLRDINLKPQIDHCDNPDYFFRWDFDGFRRLFQMKKPEPVNDLEANIFWSPRSRMVFQDTYRADIRVWSGPYAPVFRKTIAEHENEITDATVLGGSEIDDDLTPGGPDEA